MKTLGYGIKQGFKNIVQNKIFSLVAIGTIAICLFCWGCSMRCLAISST